MARRTRFRAEQTTAADSYSPNPDQMSLATDAEVEERVRKHSRMFHHHRNDFLEFIYDSNGNLTEMKTYWDVAKTTLAGTAEMVYSGDLITKIVKKIYEMDGVMLYSHLEKRFLYNLDEDLESIQTVKLV